MDGSLNQQQILNAMLVMLPISNTRPGVPNYRSGQYGLAEDIISDALSLFSSQEVPPTSSDLYAPYVATNYADIAIRLSTSPLSLFGPEIVALFSKAIIENDDDPCVNQYNQGIGRYDKLCDALDENDLREVVGDADFNIDICHSLTDELVSYRNVPDEFDPSFVTIFNITEASHLASAFFCGARVADLVSKNPFHTPALAAGCSDRKDKWKIGHKSKFWCKWARKNGRTEISKRCARKKLYKHCPKTCNWLCFSSQLHPPVLIGTTDWQSVNISIYKDKVIEIL